jgi:Arc/MetJ family transcription regulator
MEKMKRINVDINDELLEKAMRFSGIKTKKELVNTALRFYRDLLLEEQKEQTEQNPKRHENKH